MNVDVLSATYCSINVRRPGPQRVVEYQESSIQDPVEALAYQEQGVVIHSEYWILNTEFSALCSGIQYQESRIQ